MPIIPPPNPFAYTVGYLINRTFDLLLGAAREDLNVVGSPIGINDTTIQCTQPSGRMNQGTYIAIDDEVLYVFGAVDNSNGTTVTVLRAMKGTSASSHAANTIVYVNPYFTRYQVRNTLQDEIRSWGPQIYCPQQKIISGTDFVRGYDLGLLGSMYRVLDVRRSPDTIWATPDPEDWPSVKWEVLNNAPSTDFSSSQALIITDPIPVFDSPHFCVIYAAPFAVDTPQGINTVPFQDGDSLTSMGIDNSDIDIAPYGAAWRLASSREIRRMLTEAMGQTADLRNFPPGYMVKTAEEFKNLRDSRLQDAEERLLQQYPIKRK